MVSDWLKLSGNEEENGHEMACKGQETCRNRSEMVDKMVKWALSVCDGKKLVLNGLKWSGNVRETVGKHPGYGPK